MTTHVFDPSKGRPVEALAREDVHTGDKIVSYVPGDASSVRRFQIVAPPQHEEHAVEDSRGDLLVWVCNLDTGVVTQVDTATLGLTCSPDGTRTRWAVPFNDD